jgi:hypothetical protein
MLQGTAYCNFRTHLQAAHYDGEKERFYLQQNNLYMQGHSPE